VDRDGHGFQLDVGDDLSVNSEAWIFDGDPPYAPCPQCSADKGQQMQPACWLAEPLPFTGGRRQTIPHLLSAKYPGT
jgi:hypothetical protein